MNHVQCLLKTLAGSFLISCLALGSQKCLAPVGNHSPLHQPRWMGSSVGGGKKKSKPSHCYSSDVNKGLIAGNRWHVISTLSGLRPALPPPPLHSRGAHPSHMLLWRVAGLLWWRTRLIVRERRVPPPKSPHFISKAYDLHSFVNILSYRHTNEQLFTQSYPACLYFCERDSLPQNTFFIIYSP